MLAGQLIFPFRSGSLIDSAVSTAGPTSVLVMLSSNSAKMICSSSPVSDAWRLWTLRCSSGPSSSSLSPISLVCCTRFRCGEHPIFVRVFSVLWHSYKPFHNCHMFCHPELLSDLMSVVHVWLSSINLLVSHPPRSHEAMGVFLQILVHIKMMWVLLCKRCVPSCWPDTPILLVSPSCHSSLQVVTVLFTVVS